MNFNFIFYIFFLFGIPFALFSTPPSISLPNSNLELVSTYECGFSSFNESRFLLNINFYIIALLFTSPDPEVILFFPPMAIIMRSGLSVVLLSYLSIAIICISYFFELKMGIFNFDDILINIFYYANSY